MTFSVIRQRVWALPLVVTISNSFPTTSGTASTPCLRSAGEQALITASIPRKLKCW